MARSGPRSLRLLAPIGALVLGLALGSCGDDPDQPVSSPATSTSSTPEPGPPDAPGDELTVAVEPSPAPPGSTVQATVQNGTTKEFTYGAAYELDHQVDGAWEMIELPSRPVIEIAYVAPPGKSGGALAVELPGELEPGTYRVVITRDAPGFGLVAGELEVADG